MPTLPVTTKMRRRIHAFQRYITAFEYVHHLSAHDDEPCFHVPFSWLCAHALFLDRGNRYNHTGRLYFNVRRDAGLQKLMIQAKVRAGLLLSWVVGSGLKVNWCPCVSSQQAIVRQALPIQCMEALFLATYLTAGYKDVRACGGGAVQVVRGCRAHSHWASAGAVPADLPLTSIRCVCLSCCVCLSVSSPRLQDTCFVTLCWPWSMG